MLFAKLLRIKDKLLVNIILIISFVYSTKNCSALYDIDSSGVNVGCLIPALYMGVPTILLATIFNMYWGYCIYKSRQDKQNYRFQVWWLSSVAVGYLMLFLLIRI